MEGVYIVHISVTELGERWLGDVSERIKFGRVRYEVCCFGKWKMPVEYRQGVFGRLRNYLTGKREMVVGIGRSTLRTTYCGHRSKNMER